MELLEKRAIELENVATIRPDMLRLSKRTLYTFYF